MTRNKYSALRTEVDGHIFDSRGEAEYYKTLKIRWLAKEIFDLELQPVYPIILNGVKVCKVIGDFRYREDGRVVVDDFKGFQTSISRLKHKLIQAFYPDLEWRIVRK